MTELEQITKFVNNAEKGDLLQFLADNQNTKKYLISEPKRIQRNFYRAWLIDKTSLNKYSLQFDIAREKVHVVFSGNLEDGILMSILNQFEKSKDEVKQLLKSSKLPPRFRRFLK